MRPAVVSIAAIGRVMRRARNAATTAATDDRADGREEHDAARLPERARLDVLGEHDDRREAARPAPAAWRRTPCCRRGRSGSRRRAASGCRDRRATRPGGSLSTELSVPNSRPRISCWSPFASSAMTAPSETVSVVSISFFTRGARLVPASRSRSCCSVSLSAPLNTSLNAAATSGAFCCSSLRALLVAVRRARLAVIPAVTTSTPSAIASIATVSRVRSLRRGRLTSRRRASPTPGGNRCPAPS